MNATRWKEQMHGWLLPSYSTEAAFQRSQSPYTCPLASPITKYPDPGFFLFLWYQRKGYSKRVHLTWATYPPTPYFLCGLALGRVLAFSFQQQPSLLLCLRGPPLFPLRQSLSGTVFLSSSNFCILSSFPSLSRSFCPLKPHHVKLCYFSFVSFLREFKFYYQGRLHPFLLEILSNFSFMCSETVSLGS